MEEDARQPEVDEKVADSQPVQGQESDEKAEQQDESEALRKKVAEESFKRREQRRRADDLEKRLKEIESKSAPKFDGNIPDMPDADDFDFEEKVRAREAAIAKKAEADAHASYRREQEAEQQRTREREEFQRSEKVKQDFWKNAHSLGVSEESVRDAASIVVQQGVTPEVEGFIMESKEGPLMVQYLAANPLELENILDEKNPVKVGAMLSELKSKSSSLKPKTSNAPPPPDVVDGEVGISDELRQLGVKFY